MYTLTEKFIPPLEESDLLKEKLILSDLNGQNQALHDISERWMMEEDRINKLREVYGEYQLQRDQLISRAVMKSKHNVHESAENFKGSVK